MNQIQNSIVDLFIKFNKLIIIKFYGFLVLFQSPRKFDMAMKIKRDELKEQQSNNRQVNEITENNYMQAFGVTEDQMDKATTTLERSESTEKSGNSLA